MSNQSKVKLNWQVFPIELLVIVAYLLMGFLGKLWHPGWVVFLVIPLYHWLVAVITTHRVKGVPTAVAAVVSVVAFLLMGFLGDLWHPGWVVFFLIPITASLESFFSGGLRGQVERKKEDIKQKVKASFHDSIVKDDEDHPIE